EWGLYCAARPRDARGPAISKALHAQLSLSWGTRFTAFEKSPNQAWRQNRRSRNAKPGSKGGERARLAQERAKDQSGFPQEGSGAIKCIPSAFQANSGHPQAIPTSKRPRPALNRASFFDGCGVAYSCSCRFRISISSAKAMSLPTRPSIFRTACNTVVWSRPPKRRPISGSERRVKVFARYIATCRGRTTLAVRRDDNRSERLTLYCRATTR